MWASWAFSAVVLLSLYVLFVPQPVGPAGPPGADKVVHALLFAALAVTTRIRFGPAVRLLAFLAVYAVGSELVQAVVLPDRSGDAYDVVADLVGASVGWWVVEARANTGT